MRAYLPGSTRSENHGNYQQDPPLGTGVLARGGQPVLRIKRWLRLSEHRIGFDKWTLPV
jgi:hypothetical protein